MSNFFLGNHYYEKISTRKNKSINTRKYNIGISRVPLTDVQEITEYEDSTDNYPTSINKSKEIASKNKKFGCNTLVKKKLFEKGKKNQITRKKESSKSSIDSSSSAKLSVRLRGGTDFLRPQLVSE
ncbi:hypothetical protein M0804_009515 [Polistes exclamans]|nr:hypothetical protein M0804_009515 [Polistes exclamans]